MATHADLYGTPALRLATTLRAAFVGLTAGGALAAVLTGGADWSAIPLLGGAAGTTLAQLAVGILGYRRAMAHEWPKVEPIADDDDW